MSALLPLLVALSHARPGYPPSRIRPSRASWEQVQAGDGRHHSHHWFQDAERLWRCDAQRCEVAWGAAAPGFALPCRAGRDPTATSRSGVWLAQICQDTLHVFELSERKWQQHALQREHVHYLSVDDAGVATASTNDGSVCRASWGAELAWFSLERPPAADHVRPLDPPWLAVSDGAFADEVVWRASEDPQPILLGGGALVNGPHVWVSLMDSGYARLTPDGPVPLDGGEHIRGALLPHGGLGSIEPLGPDALLIGYERAVVLVDSELVSQRLFVLPETEAAFTIGSNPQGTVLHHADAFGRAHVLRLP